MNIVGGAHFSRVCSRGEGVRITSPLTASKAKPCSKEHLVSGQLLSKKHFLVNLEIVGTPKAKHI